MVARVRSEKKMIRLIIIEKAVFKCREEFLAKGAAGISGWVRVRRRVRV